LVTMHALIRNGRQVMSSQLQGLTRAAASTATSSSRKSAMEKEFLVYRWDPEEDRPPEYQSYKVDLNS